MMQVPSRLPAMENPAADRTGPVPQRTQSSEWPPTVRDNVQGRADGHDESAARSYAGALTGRLWNSAWTLLVLGNVFWASNIIVGRAILGDVPAIALSFWRWTGAFAVAFWFAWPHLKKDWPVLLAHWKIMLLLAATGIAFFNTVAYIGLAGTTALNVLLMQSSLPLVVTVWAFVLLKEWPSGWQLVAITISLAGVAFVAARGSLDALLALRFYRADVWVMASVIILGSYMVLLRLRPDVHPLSFMQAAMGLGALMVAPLYLRELSLGMRITDHWQNFAGIAYMAVFPSFISYLFFNRGVQLIGATRAGQSTHLIPITGSIMAVMFLSETLHVYHFVGIVLIGAGIGLAQLKAPVR
jgi:drug/metabolite transporter (DMT)-like permease